MVSSSAGAAGGGGQSSAEFPLPEVVVLESSEGSGSARIESPSPGLSPVGESSGEAGSSPNSAAGAYHPGEPRLPSPEREGGRGSPDRRRPGRVGGTFSSASLDEHGTEASSDICLRIGRSASDRARRIQRIGRKSGPTCIHQIVGPDQRLTFES